MCPSFKFPHCNCCFYSLTYFFVCVFYIRNHASTFEGISLTENGLCFKMMSFQHIPKGQQINFSLLERSAALNIIHDWLHWLLKKCDSRCISCFLVFQNHCARKNVYGVLLSIKISKILRGKYLRKEACLHSKHTVSRKLKNSIYFVGGAPDKMNQMKCVYVNINCLKSSCNFQGSSFFIGGTELIMTSKTLPVLFSRSYLFNEAWIIVN